MLCKRHVNRPLRRGKIGASHTSDKVMDKRHPPGWQMCNIGADDQKLGEHPSKNLESTLVQNS
jgi:hypothetical protein